MSFLCLPALLTVFVASYTCVFRAQSTDALVADRVTDPSEAAIVGTRVAALSTDTNFRYDGNTNGGGALDGSAL